MKRLNAVLFLVIALILPTSILAQQRTPTPRPNNSSNETCEDAQEWYDSASDPTELLQAFLTAITSTNRTSERVAAIDVFTEVVEAIEENEDYPECLETPRQYYIDGLTIMADGMTAYLDEELGDYVIKSMEASLKIGAFRGYLEAMGVELFDVSELQIYFK